ncbi:MAG: hypothetical protein M1587_08125, partial [Thaumarchaeota archaeon]|nr:hypothetical protein [Nitrososphaerota archaeon]
MLSQIAGYVGVRTMEMGLRFGLLDELAKYPQGLSAADLAKQKELDPFYVQVWCRAAYAAELLDYLEGKFYRLAPYMDKLLLDRDFPGYAGGLPSIMEQPEIFDKFADNLSKGEHIWWNQCSPDFIHLVGSTGRPFYTRLIGGGLSRVPGLAKLMEEGAQVVELACGVGGGLVQM